MPPVYSLIVVPLDTREPARHSAECDCQIVCEVTFPPNESFAPEAVRKVLAQHPILNRWSGPIYAHVMKFDDWEGAGRVFDPAKAVRLALLPRSPENGDVTRGILSDLFGAKGELRAEAVAHDPSFDELEDVNFVDVALAADNVAEATGALQRAAATLLSRVGLARNGQPVTGSLLFNADTARSAESVAWEDLTASRWINSVSQRVILAALSRRDADDVAVFGEMARSGTPRDVREALSQITKRVTRPEASPSRLASAGVLRQKGADGQEHVTGYLDPNVIARSALKNALVARLAGFVSPWMIKWTSELIGSDDWLIQIDAASVPTDPTVAGLEVGPPTAFRRRGHTHPVSFWDSRRVPGVQVGPDGRKTGNCAMALLNEDDGTPRYRASSVETESGIVKQVILQSQNSLASLSESASANDSHEPQILKTMRFGLPEPETSGITISAPVSDLVTPAELRKLSPQERMASMPCYFLDDLWVGYRLDIKRAQGGKYLSTQRYEANVTLRATGVRLQGSTEEYAEREQQDDPSVGATSTELTRYAGLSMGQMADYLALLGKTNPRAAAPDQPFAVEIASYGQSERLVFGGEYSYRLRNVFVGGISCADDEEDLERLLSSDGRYTQTVPFYRARALRAGVVFGTSTRTDTATRDGATVALTKEHGRQILTVLPSPLDLDGCRFHGLVLSSLAEPRRHHKRRIIADLSKAFAELPPNTLDYFLDPDVYGFVCHARWLNGDDSQDPEGFVQASGSLCRVAKHVSIDPVTVYYGRPGRWEEFVPVVIEISASSGREPKMRQAAAWRGRPTIEIEVPPAGQLALSLVPVFERGLLVKTAAHVASSGQFAMRARSSGRPLVAVPAVAEESIRVVHMVDAPRREPTLICDERKAVLQEGEVVGGPCAGHRSGESEYAELAGRVEVDAASTGGVRLEAVWQDIHDDEGSETYILTQGNTRTAVKSLVFHEYVPAELDLAAARSLLVSRDDAATKAFVEQRVGTTRFGMLDQFGLQCAEDVVFVGANQPGGATEPDRPFRLDVRDQRRKLLKVEAVATSRFVDQAKGDVTRSERRSPNVGYDVPSAVRMSAPRVSHVVPLRRELNVTEGSRREVGALFGLRIYLHRPWFESGPGERLAIGCAIGSGTPTPPVQEVPKHVTQWGEDPLERAALEVTTRMPRARDFTAETGRRADDRRDSMYPPNATGGAESAIYRDNIELAPGERYLSTASYTVAFDQEQRLWFTDVHVLGGFFGWLGLALYRHQPHAVAGREVSETSAWAYGAILYGEPMAWTERRGSIHLVIGPVYDAAITFAIDSLDSDEGVSERIDAAPRTVTPLKSYTVGSATYFEGVLSQRQWKWGLLKLRFGRVVGARSMR